MQKPLNFAEITANRVGVVALVLLLAVLSFPNLPALRYWLLVVMLGVVLVGHCKSANNDWVQWKPALPWVIFLLLFPFLAVDFFEGLRGVLKQWWPPALAMMLVLVLGQEKYLRGENPSRLALIFGLAGAIPLFLHVVMACAVWLGILPALANGYWAPPEVVPNGDWFSRRVFPWGYWGVHLHHADLGYAALQSVVLLISAGIGHASYRRWWLLLALGISVVSPFVAHSRAGFAFAIAGIVVTLFFWGVGARPRWLKPSLWAMGAGVIALALSLPFLLHTDERWLGIFERLTVGFYGNPEIRYCQGAEAFEASVRLQHPELTERRVAEIVTVGGDGDGARTQMLKLGLVLASEHPLGIDGTKQSSQKALALHCANPATPLAHTHNGWLDTALALGWAGALIYLSLLIHFCRTGWRALRAGRMPLTWPLVLVSLSALWILRGLFDSVYRDHMLWMQALMLGFAYAQVTSRSSNP